MIAGISDILVASDYYQRSPFISVRKLIESSHHSQVAQAQLQDFSRCQSKWRIIWPHCILEGWPDLKRWWHRHTSTLEPQRIPQIHTRWLWDPLMTESLSQPIFKFKLIYDFHIKNVSWIFSSKLIFKKIPIL